MAVASLYVLHGIQTPTSFIDQISNARPSPRITQMMGVPTGHFAPLFRAVEGLQPEVTFDSTKLKTILDLISAGVMADLSGGNTDLYFKKAVYLGTRVADATTSHTRLRMSNAGLIIQNISAGNRSEAKASCLLVASYDGTNAPIVPAGGSVALAGTAQSAQHFYAGPCYLNTVLLTGIQDITIDFGTKLFRINSDGELYDSFVGVEVTEPSITIRAINVPWETYGLNGTALTAGSFYLRAKEANKANLADGTAGHIKFAATSGIITIDDTAAGDNNPATTTIRVSFVGASLAALPLTVTGTAIAITT